jgi:hypothetical protein
VDARFRDCVESLSGWGQIALFAESSRDCDGVRIAGAFALAERQLETYAGSAAMSCLMLMSPITRFML